MSTVTITFWNGKYPISIEARSLSEAIELMAKNGANLTRADLTGADLTRAKLTRANLTGANLYGADLTRANLTGANLYGADLYGANLTGANLTGANLTRADLTGADLTRANLTGANLYGADLTGGFKYHGETQTIIPVQIQGFKYPATISRSSMQIGCQLHTHAEWESFSDDAINNLDGEGNLDSWKEMKPLLMKLCASHRMKSDAIILPEEVMS